MTRAKIAGLAFSLCVASHAVAAETSTPPHPACWAAVPTAWERPPGWSATRGGDDGRILIVDTLAADGPGSLAAALATEGPRKIVFTVGGLIDLKGGRLPVRRPHVTIAGETAPSPGITIIRGGMGVSTHDVIVRHIRIRPGAADRIPGQPWDIDGLATGGGAHDVIVDHCSISWSTDENLSASGPRFEGTTPDEWRRNTSHRITFSHCLVAEALHKSTHSKGVGHSMGSLIHDNTSEIAIIGNLYVSNNARNPLFKGGARGVVVNNYIHNPGGTAITYGLVPQEWEGHEWQRGQMAIVGNVVRHGPSTSSSGDAIRFGSRYGAPLCDAFVHDNQLFDRAGQPLARGLTVFARPGLAQPGEFRLVSEPPLWPAGFQARPASVVVEWVLANAGARPWDRDSVDRRLVDETRAGRGKIIDSEAEVGGHPALSAK